MDDRAPLAIDREVTLIIGALRREFPELARHVEQLVRDVAAQTLAAARVPAYLPPLIHQRARWQLKHLRHEPQLRFAGADPVASSSSAPERLAVRLRRI
jgi:hypothetical protein